MKDNTTSELIAELNLHSEIIGSIVDQAIQRNESAVIVDMKELRCIERLLNKACLRISSESDSAYEV